MGNRKAQEVEIEVTPEMAEAGIGVLMAALDGCSSLEGIALRAPLLAKEVYLAMRRTEPE